MTALGEGKYESIITRELRRHLNHLNQILERKPVVAVKPEFNMFDELLEIVEKLEKKEK